MTSPVSVRPARIEDVAQMARVIVRCWQETYRGLMPDAVLDDPGQPAARERFWTAALTEEHYRDNRVVVAERDGELVGVAMSGPPLDAGATWARQLYVLYVHAADHGTGAGEALLDAVLRAEESVALWVADPNPRAQAFYRKHGFVPDGATQVVDDVRHVRMLRDRRLGSRSNGDTFPMPVDFEFEGPVVEWRGPAPFYFVAIPEPDSDDIKFAAKGLEYWGQVPVVVRIGDVEFATALFPKDGRYLLPLKDAVRRSAGIALDDVLSVALRVGRL